MNKEFEKFLKTKPVREIIGDNDNGTYDKYESSVLNAIKQISDSGRVPKNGWYKTLANFMLCGVDEHTWEHRLETLFSLEKPNSHTLEIYKIKFGDEHGQIRFDEMRAKRAYLNSFEHKQKKYGWTRDEFDEYNKSRAVTLKNLVKKHGEEVGLEKWNQYCERQKYTNTLEYFIEKYGEDAGTVKWNNFAYNRNNSNKIEYVMERYSISRDEAALVISERLTPKNSSSIAEEDLVKRIEDVIGWEFKYSHKTKQFAIWSDLNNRIQFYDMCCPERKKIIEFFGDYWHCNPNNYSSDFVVTQSNMTAEEIWKYDENKIKTAKDRGFDVMVIWESDLQDAEIYDKIIKFLGS